MSHRPRPGTDPRKHLFLAVSGHGLGHLCQVAPVVNRLRALRPGLRLTVQAAVPERRLHERIEGEFIHIPEAADFGMVMDNALDVRVEDSLAAYRDFHADWEAHLALQCDRLRSHSPDLVLANVPYLPLAAAQRLGIPCAGLCSLNWAEILRHYASGERAIAAVCDFISGIYAQADVFLAPAPSMPMPALRNLHAIGPIARRGRERRTELRAALGLDAAQRLVLVNLGGIATDLQLSRWPRITDTHWLVEPGWKIARADCHTWEGLGLHFTDLLPSVDAFVMKPGYGSVAEAACNGVATLYVERGDWPEEPHLVRWLEAHARSQRIERAALLNGELAEPLSSLLARPPMPPVDPVGIAEAADSLLALLE